jgi:4-cresol dehydrogenase (hydroxylating)
MCGSAALELVDRMEPIFAEYRFEPLITMTSITPRALCCVSTIAFDKEDSDECRRAKDCYHRLFDAVVAAGFIPYRVGLESMEKLAEGAPTHWEVVHSLKTALDPHGVLAPGRYSPIH